MSSFAILRVQKLKSAVAIQRTLKHAHREQLTPNADGARTQLNSAACGSSAEALERFSARLATQKHVRKNAVVAVEYFVGGSPDAMRAMSPAAQDAYFSDAREWLERRHAKENIVDFGVHRDETTPHAWAIVVPIDRKGKLNCRHFLGGAKALSDMQTSFAEEVGKPHGLQRGVAGSKAKHQRVSQYYTRVNSAFQPLPPVKTPPPKPLRPAPAAKPWWQRMFMSRDERASYKSECATWTREKSAHDQQAKQRAAEVRARQAAAVDIARTLEAKASQAAELRRENDRLKTSAAGHAQQSTQLRRLISHFKPDEVAAARRLQAEAEQRRADEAAKTEHAARIAECESILREAPTRANSPRRISSGPKLS